ncbi:trypsin-1-like [Frankliniella occidentalis]|uniref:Trypsin-1-like n=1 Tax=Frankliniella occidentalis TaxID=133901 RepID=A0A9C6X8H0_FRAOC|nr:trypsin-1-like [Frankliniella occidentalis]
MSSALAVFCAVLVAAYGLSAAARTPPDDISTSSPFALAALGPLGAAGARRGPPVQRDYIVGGSDARPGEFPHQASMQVVLPGWLPWWDAAPQHLCGGALVAARWALTAAHCVLGVPAEAKRVEVVLGVTRLSAARWPWSWWGSHQRIRVRDMLVHEEYVRGIHPHDIALLGLSEAAVESEAVRFARLPHAYEAPAGVASLSGWGSTSEDGDQPVYPDKLQRADFPVIDYAACRAFLDRINQGRYNPLDPSMLCVGHLDAAHLGSCSGDSGGPLVQRQDADDDQAPQTLVGLVSWGLTDCGSQPYPSVLTSVSQHMDWITNKTQQYGKQA